jgi:outer membrane protein assembly factor BamA
LKPRPRFFLAILFLIFSLPSDAQNDSSRLRSLKIKTLRISGNKTTKEHIILRELMFHAGDSLSREQLDEACSRSKQNLMNTSLFNFVTITYDSSSDSCVNVRIDCRERWFTWPVPIFEFYEQNFNTWLLHPSLNRLDYGINLNRYNFLGRKQILSIILRMGYSEQYGFTYSIPYINSKQHSGLIVGLLYSRTHEIPYACFANKLDYYKDNANYVRYDIAGRAGYTYRQGIYNTYFAELRYAQAHISDTIRKLSDVYFSQNQNTMNYVSANLGFVRDLRDSKPYPLKGYYIQVGMNKTGLGVLSKTPDFWQLSVLLRKYWQWSDRISSGIAFKGKWSGQSNVPFYFQTSVGFRDYVRGYEYYVMQGQSYALLKTVWRYQIVKPHVKQIPFLPLEKFNTFHYAFYAGLFADMGYVQSLNELPQMMNSLTNTMLYGYGAGIDFVTYYDIVIRAEYSFNKMGESGLFLHFNSAL